MCVCVCVCRGYSCSLERWWALLRFFSFSRVKMMTRSSIIDRLVYNSAASCSGYSLALHTYTSCKREYIAVGAAAERTRLQQQRRRRRRHSTGRRENGTVIVIGRNKETSREKLYNIPTHAALTSESNPRLLLLDVWTLLLQLQSRIDVVLLPDHKASTCWASNPAHTDDDGTHRK